MTGRLRRSTTVAIGTSRVAPVEAAIAATIVVAVATASLTWSGDARAHKVGLSSGEYVVKGNAVTAELVLARGELVQLAPEADLDRDGALSSAELSAGRAALERGVVGRIEVRAGGDRCQGALVDAVVVESDGVKVAALYGCPAVPRAGAGAGGQGGDVTVTLGLFERLAHGHRHLATMRAGERAHEAVLFEKDASISISVASVGEAGEGARGPAGGARRGREASAFELFRLGVTHILEGVDHLAFLLGLVVVGGRWSSMFAVVSAFTVGHSVSLALAVLGVWAPSPRLVEPLIALSIVAVGVENFWRRDASGRWRASLPFGLVHGFGFAGGLLEVGVSRARVPVALGLFNLGVEVGQLAVLAVALPLVARLSRTTWFAARGVRATSALLVVAGLYWFVERVFFEG